MSVFAIVESGNRQYRVEEKDVIQVEKLGAQAGSELALDRVLVIKTTGDIQVGTPFVGGAKVLCKVLGDERQAKVIHYRIRRRKNSKRKHGHRQTLTKLQVTAIQG